VIVTLGLPLLRWLRDKTDDFADYLDMWADILDPDYLDGLRSEPELDVELDGLLDDNFTRLTDESRGGDLTYG
jgi:hypothetical protein